MKNLNIKKIILLISLLTSQALAECNQGKYERLAETIGQQHGLPPFVLSSLIKQESGFCDQSVSPRGAIGLGQLLPGTASDLGVNPYDITDNLHGAARYLQSQFQKFKNWEFAFAAYNAGPGNVSKYGGIPPFKETQNYVQRVMNNYQNYLGSQKNQTSQASETIQAPVQTVNTSPIITKTPPIKNIQIPQNKIPQPVKNNNLITQVKPNLSPDQVKTTENKPVFIPLPSQFVSRPQKLAEANQVVFAEQINNSPRITIIHSRTLASNSAANNTSQSLSQGQ